MTVETTNVVSETVRITKCGNLAPTAVLLPVARAALVIALAHHVPLANLAIKEISQTEHLLGVGVGLVTPTAPQRCIVAPEG